MFDTTIEGVHKSNLFCDTRDCRMNTPYIYSLHNAQASTHLLFLLFFISIFHLYMTVHLKTVCTPSQSLRKHERKVYKEDEKLYEKRNASGFAIMYIT